MANQIKLSSFSGVNKNSTARVSMLPFLYQQILIKTNVAIEQIKRVTILHMGEVAFSLTGLEIAMLHGYKRLHATDGVLCISLSDQHGKSYDSSLYSGLMAKQGESLTLEVELGEAENIELQAFALVAPSDDRLVYARTSKINISCHGDSFEFANLFQNFGRMNPVRLRRIHIKSADLQSFKLYQNSYKTHDLDAEINASLLRNYKLSPQSGYFHFDPIMRGYLIRELVMLDEKTVIKGKLKNPATHLEMIVETVEQVAEIKHAEA